MGSFPSDKPSIGGKAMKQGVCRWGLGEWEEFSPIPERWGCLGTGPDKCPA